MTPIDTEVFERLRTVETISAVHDVEIKSIKDGMGQMEARIKEAGSEREKHIIEKIEWQSRMLQKILWALATAVLGTMLNLASGWIKKVDQAHETQQSARD